MFLVISKRIENAHSTATDEDNKSTFTQPVSNLWFFEGSKIVRIFHEFRIKHANLPCPTPQNHKFLPIIPALFSILSDPKIAPIILKLCQHNWDKPTHTHTHPYPYLYAYTHIYPCPYIYPGLYVQWSHAWVIHGADFKPWDWFSTIAHNLNSETYHLKCQTLKNFIDSSASSFFKHRLTES